MVCPAVQNTHSHLSHVRTNELFFLALGILLLNLIISTGVDALKPFTPDGASSGQFPEHQAQRVNICPLERFKALCIDRLVQEFRSHVPAEDEAIKA